MGCNFFCGQVDKSVTLLTFSKSHQSCVGTTPVLLSVGVVKTNRRKRHFKGKSSKKPIGNADSEQLFNFVWSVCAAQCFFGSPEQKQYRPCLCEGVAGRRPATPSHKHGIGPPLGSQQKGRLRVQRCVFRV